MKDYKELLNKYLNGTCTEQERTLLDQWYQSLDSGVHPSESEKEKSALIHTKWKELISQDERMADFTAIRPKKSMIQRLQQLPLLWSAAAAVLLLVGLYWLFSTGSFHSSTVPNALSRTITLDSTDMLVVANQADTATRVVLSDGSTVTLSPHSQIHYPKLFGQNERKVYLTGEAFFEVTKNPAKPFLVYANDIVAKVLGTSFLVSTRQGKSDVSVSVKTGRVSVFTPQLTAGSPENIDPETTGVLLTPNQQVVYLSQERKLVKTLVENPDVLISEEQLKLFTFENAPASTIFEAIETAYGVDIIYDEELMKRCLITTSLDGERLHTILETLSRLMDAPYKIIDAQIVFFGNGC